MVGVGDSGLGGASRDISAHRVIPFPRAGPFPRAQAAEIYGCDARITPENLARLRADAVVLARIAGFDAAVPAAAAPAAAAGVGSAWRVSDTAHRSHAAEVPDAAMANGNVAVVRGNAALVELDWTWVTAEKVSDDKVLEWKREKSTGPGRDSRILGDGWDTVGAAFMAFDQAVGKFTEVEMTG